MTPTLDLSTCTLVLVRLLSPSPSVTLVEVGRCGSFFAPVLFSFWLQPANYPTNKAKIVFVLNLLPGRAGQWAHAAISSQTCASTYFKAEFVQVFDHLTRGA